MIGYKKPDFSAEARAVVKTFDAEAEKAVEKAGKALAKEARRGVSLTELEKLPQADQILLKATGQVNYKGRKVEEKARKTVVQTIVKHLNKIFGKND